MKRKTLAPILLLLLVTTACLHKPSGTITARERVHAYNASFAQANDSLESGLEAAVSTNLMSAAQAGPMIQACGQVATVHLQVTSILGQATITQANIDSVASLLDQIKASVNAIPPAALGIKNPKSQQTFLADFNNVYTLADAIIASLKAAGVQ